MKEVVKIILVVLAATVGLARACKRCSSVDDVARLGKQARYADDGDPDFLKYAKYADLLPSGSGSKKDGYDIQPNPLYRYRSYDTIHFERLSADSVLIYKHQDKLETRQTRKSSSYHQGFNCAVLVTNTNLGSVAAEKYGRLGGARLICEKSLFERLQKDNGYEVFSFLDEYKRERAVADSEGNAEHERDAHYVNFLNERIAYCRNKNIPSYILQSEQQQLAYGNPIDSYSANYRIKLRFYSLSKNALYESDLSKISLALSYPIKHRPNSLIKYISDFHWRLEQSFPEAAARLVCMTIEENSDKVLRWVIYTE